MTLSNPVYFYEENYYCCHSSAIGQNVQNIILYGM
jgi:hypothetical protein